MEFKIIWSPEAIDDLEGLIRFVCGDNPRAAERLGERIIGRAESLARHASLGSTVLKRPSAPVRKLPAPPFLIFYTARRPER